MKIEKVTPNGVILEELGQRLAKIRKQQGLSQTRLAEEAGLGVATLRRIEAGQDSQLESWLKILKSLGMTASIDNLLPENFRSPMQEALSQTKKRSKTDKTNGLKWGDEA